ncbi:terminase DNA binding subunit 2 [Phascolarctid gammaherpesvirus 1]|uniref:Terminase DNA binding subunit 2 n=1 Tax=Phascolarctid gammaherpesvirus 1 TaxID=2249313 RepID=A0A3S8D7P1_9GAMA|nr:terminase DNA binding subunit 2 [Phascolarctid gammaherpesvirus 1]AZB49185.1 terminase DNA binding subunit 2 [Phascolarctid gammaherpesvirus 1]
MTQELALIFAHINGLAMETCLIQYCDPASLDKQIILENYMQLSQLSMTLSPLLEKQHAIRTSPISLELHHLIKNLSSELKKIIELIHDGLDHIRYFSELHDITTCPQHFTGTMQFYGPCEVPISLYLINDVEILLKRLNAVFFCSSYQSTLKLLAEVGGFVQGLRGISPIPLPTVYNTTSPCITCSLEATLVPNQGESILANLIHCNCSHLCSPVRAEPIIGLFENELTQSGLVFQGTTYSHTASTTEHIPFSDTPPALLQYNIFQKVTPYIIDLSNLIYWNSGIKSRVAEKDKKLCSNLGKLLFRDTQMTEIRHKYYSSRKTPISPNHYFDMTKPDPLESLFTGGIFYSIGDTIEALKKDCSELFTRQANYQSILEQHNELYVRLNMALNGSLTNIQHPSPASTNATAPAMQRRNNVQRDSEQVKKDALARKEHYLKKVSKDGMDKLNRCLEKQASVLHDTLTLRVWGATMYTSLSNIMNHYLNRKLLLDTSRYEPGLDDFENCKYIKNILYTHSLSKEHISDLTMTFYRLLTGPLIKNEDMFPISINNQLAHALDAAGALAHHKIMIKSLIWPTIEPKDWIDIKHNMFYTISTTDLSICQREAMAYIRELVLSIALYNLVWKKSLEIYTPDFSSLESLKDGVYLTFEPSSPLVLVYGMTRRIFKDVYSMLYLHLQVE